MALTEIITWLVVRGLALAIGAGVLLLCYRGGAVAIHRFVPRILYAQAAHLPAGTGPTVELDKRVATVEDLLLRLLRLAFLALLVSLALAVFDLWAVLAAIVIIIVAITFATQEVVLDYVMGFLILVEGPYFKGDWIRVGGTGGIEGTVEEIGLRRTMLRDGLGSANAVSNGLIRLSSNVTRMFSVATAEVQILHAADLERAIEAAARAMADMREDDAWRERITADAPTDVWVMALTVDGATLRVQQKVVTGAQGAAASELRRRLASALATAGIGTGRWDTPLPIAQEGVGPTRP